ncbi:methyl-accepting chemotaxis protein [Thalassobaculum sp. OXR-137]|uniref:methyl-accepting chemotaxis protein n=1 Tax=Thalassobaculum sp. OXR-137 TaxID=3100173 RepID=UPI002AC9C329|nr:methyl-accepting chemotaxis protein [Thalassobaculum sp. OXR-137]WPZ33472.1 methyl-accepting chemotaxis protein [Thalassobaculum sp. OXR-137]
MSALNNISIGRKFAGAFGILVAIMLVSGALTFYQLSRATDAAKEVDRVNTLLDTLTAMQGNAIDQSGSIKELLISGDRTSIDRYRQQGEAFDAASQTMLNALADDPETKRLTEEFIAVNRQWRETAERQIALMRQPFTVDEARQIESNGAGREYVAALSQKFETLKERGNNIVSDATAKQDQIFIIVEVFAAGSALLGVIFAALAYLVLNRGISLPISAMSVVMGQMATGNHNVTVPGAGRGDEVGQMAEAVEVFRRNMVENERLQAEAAAKQKAELDRAQALRDITQQFETEAQSMTAAVAAAATELEGTAQALNTIADQSTHQATIVATASEETSMNVQTVATASTELSASISEISHQVANANNLASAARTDAQSTESEVRALDEAVQRIGTVVTLIQEIAEQTNLLALNATIESARAGDAGKGFAVVASEVKNLAGQTGKATEEIASQIQAVQDRTRTAVNSIAKIVTRVNEVQEVAAAVAAAVEEQDSATKEISRNVEEVATAANEVNTNISGVREAASETGESSGRVLTTARSLTEQAEGLKNRVQAFLRDVRAA